MRLSRWRAVFGAIWAAARWRTLVLGGLIVLSGVLPTVVIVLTGALVDAVSATIAQDPGSVLSGPVLLRLLQLMFCLAVFSAVVPALMYASFTADTALVFHIRQQVARLILRAPAVTALEDPVLADELRAIDDAERRGVLPRTVAALSNVATTRLRGLGALIVLLGFQWWAPPLLAVAWYLTNRVYLRAAENGVSVNMNDGAERLRRAEYLLSLAVRAPAAKEVRIFGLGAWLVGRYGDVWMEALGAMWRSRRTSRRLTVAAVLALIVSHVTVLGAMGVAASRGEIDGAALLVFVQAVIATSALGMIGDWQWILAQSLAVIERVARLPERVTSPSPRIAPARRDDPDEAPVAIRLDDVRFTYRGRDQPALDGVSLDIPAGQTLAIVGENGAGKSTLIKLLCGLYEPDSGSIALAGGLSPCEARSRIAVVFQSFVRYPLTLRDNVGFGHLGLLNDTDRLDDVLRDSGAQGLLTTLPHGWNTVLSREFEGGVDLSGGQWQQVALARALASVAGGARLLILDEPTASLEARAEAEIVRRILERRGTTTILVSHRLSSVRYMDRIVVIDRGRVVEDGSHEQLMKIGGRYAKMFSLQGERFVVA